MTSALSIRQLTKTYANGFQALKGIDLEVEEGDFFGVGEDPQPVVGAAGGGDEVFDR